MIQIDDSGSGSFVGGTCIGVYRCETGEYYFDIIPVELYSRENIPLKIYLDYAIDIIAEAFLRFGVDKHEKIQFCRGYMFDRLQKWLDERNYNWERIHIEGRLQEIVEKNFEIYVTKLGVPQGYIKYTKYPFHFHKILRWLFADYDNRISLCKTGWKSWQKYKDISLEVYFEHLKKDNCYCLKCGEYIKPGQKIKVLKYTTNRDNYIYLHTNC